jgi:Leucine-rich repeat (LRR) protein
LNSPSFRAWQPSQSLSLFAHSEAREHPADSLQAAHCALDPALQDWAHRADSEGARARQQQAALHIQRCINNGSTQMNLGGLQLESLPAMLWSQTHLTSLHLGGNCLSSLPEEIGQLTRLTHLIASDNLLCGLPHSIAKLHPLQVLDLSRNWFKGLPEAVADLPNLRYLYLHQNPLQINRQALLSRLPSECTITHWHEARGEHSGVGPHTLPGHDHGPVILCKTLAR